MQIAHTSLVWTGTCNTCVHLQAGRGNTMYVSHCQQYYCYSARLASALMLVQSAQHAQAFLSPNLLMFRSVRCNLGTQQGDAYDSAMCKCLMSVAAIIGSPGQQKAQAVPGCDELGRHRLTCGPHIHRASSELCSQGYQAWVLGRM